nr:MAG TPA: hypothetical protein [Caudoviricetes sp.]
MLPWLPSGLFILNPTPFPLAVSVIEEVEVIHH